MKVLYSVKEGETCVSCQAHAGKTCDRLTLGKQWRNDIVLKLQFERSEPKRALCFPVIFHSQHLRYVCFLFSFQVV